MIDRSAVPTVQQFDGSVARRRKEYVLEFADRTRLRRYAFSRYTPLQISQRESQLGNRGDRDGVGSQRQGADGHRQAASRLSLTALLRRPAAFRPNQQRGRRWARPIEERSHADFPTLVGCWLAEDQPQLIARRPQPAVESHRLADDRDRRAAALLGRRDDHSAPPI